MYAEVAFWYKSSCTQVRKTIFYYLVNTLCGIGTNHETFLYRRKGKGSYSMLPVLTTKRKGHISKKNCILSQKLNSVI